MANETAYRWPDNTPDANINAMRQGFASGEFTFPNPSGITPTEFKVLIDPTPIEIKIGSILIPETSQEKEKYAQIKGRIVARSPHAFSYADAAEWVAVGAQKPGPGDVVIYAKYAGIRVKGKDGKEYLIVNDKDICAVVDD